MGAWWDMWSRQPVSAAGNGDDERKTARNSLEMSAEENGEYDSAGWKRFSSSLSRETKFFCKDQWLRGHVKKARVGKRGREEG